ncbi:MAG: 4Fe-4S binding protein, partial [Ktedonobacterales bacterium]
MAVKRIFLDPSRCIGCRSCVAACRECDTHKGQSMIYIDYINRGNTVATSPT